MDILVGEKKYALRDAFVMAFGFDLTAKFESSMGRSVDRSKDVHFLIEKLEQQDIKYELLVSGRTFYERRFDRYQNSLMDFTSKNHDLEYVAYAIKDEPGKQSLAFVALDNNQPFNERYAFDLLNEATDGKSEVSVVGMDDFYHLKASYGDLVAEFSLNDENMDSKLSVGAR